MFETRHLVGQIVKAVHHEAKAVGLELRYRLDRWPFARPSLHSTEGIGDVSV